MTSLFGHPITPWDVVSSLLYLAICVVGLLGNLLAIYVIVKYTRMKTVTNQYILNLSISDAIFLLDLPLIIVGGLLKRWIFGVVMCKVYFATTGINMFTGSFTLAVLSGDRYLAVCHPSKAVVYRTARNARIVILLTWVVSVLFLTPIIVYANIFPQFSPNVTNLSPNSSTLFTPTLESLYKDNDQQQQQQQHFKRLQRSIVSSKQNLQQLQQQEQQSFVIKRLFLNKPLLHSEKMSKFNNESSAIEEKVLSDVIERLKVALNVQGLKYETLNFPINLKEDIVKTFDVPEYSVAGKSGESIKNMRKRKATKDEIDDPVLIGEAIVTTPTTPTTPTSSVISASSGQKESIARYTCTVDWPQDYVIPAVHAYIIYNMVIGFVIPVMVISVLYTTLVVKLSKDPGQTSSSDEGTGDRKKTNFVKTVKKTFLSKESSFSKKSDSFRTRKSPSPKTPTIHENEILTYKTPPGVMDIIGSRMFPDGTSKVEGRSDKISTISRQITAASDSIVTARPPPPVVRNLSAFKQRKLQQPRITRLVTTIILVYVVCWLPYWAFQLHLLTNVNAVRDSRWKLTLYHIFTILSYCNSAINPILYVFTNQNFRDSFVGAVQCREDVGTKGRRLAAEQFKDGVRMRTVGPRTNSPKVAAGRLTSKTNGTKQKHFQRFYSCSPNLARNYNNTRGNNNNNNINLDITKPLNEKNLEVNEQKDVDRKSLQSSVEKVVDNKNEDKVVNADVQQSANNDNNNKSIISHDDNEDDKSGLRPDDKNNSQNIDQSLAGKVDDRIQPSDCFQNDN